MDAIELLKDDHDKVDRLFQKVKATEEGEHKALFEKIKEELDAHTHIDVLARPSFERSVIRTSIIFAGISRLFTRQVKVKFSDEKSLFIQ